MAVIGPNGYSYDLTRNIQPKGNRSFLGNDNYTSTTEVISSGKAGDVYQCNVTSIESRTENITVEGTLSPSTASIPFSLSFAVASAPVLSSLVQINPTTVRVMWTASPAASVTGYRVHYSLSGKHQNVTDIKNSTSREVTGLTNGRTYTLSVEVISSNRLPAVSEEMSITLGKWLSNLRILQLPTSLFLSFSRRSRLPRRCGSCCRSSLSQSLLAGSEHC